MKLNLRILYILLLINCIAILYIYINKKKYEYTFQTTYNSLYNYDQNPNIVSYKEIDSSSFEIITKKKYTNTNWELLINDSIKEKISGKNPKIKLHEGVNKYTLLDAKGTIFSKFTAEFFYAKKMNNTIGFDKYFIYQGNLKVDEKVNTIANWGKNETLINNEDRKEIQKILMDSLKVNLNDSTIINARKIFFYLAKKIAFAAGNPTDSVQKLNVMQQYKAALQGCKIWCGMYANILRVFYDEAGITNRYIEMEQSYGTNGNIHIINEFFNKELNQWIVSDLTFSNFCYVDASNNYMNAVTVKNNSGLNTLQAIHYEKDTIQLKTLNSFTSSFKDCYYWDRNLVYYFNNDFVQLNTPKAKLLRYFSKQPYYAIYSDVSLFSNKMFYLKIVLNAIAVFLFLLILVSKLIKIKKKTM